MSQFARRRSHLLTFESAGKVLFSKNSHVALDPSLCFVRGAASVVGRRFLSSSQDKLSFPWRHSKVLLPRIELEKYRFNKGWRSKFFVGLWERSTGLVMDKPLAELVGWQWKKDLAEQSAWAFSFGIAALLSNTFKVPMDDILIRNGEDLEINFVYTTPFTKQSTSDKDGSPKKADDKDASNDEKVDDNKHPESPFFEKVDQLFEEEILKMYKSFYQNTHTTAATATSTSSEQKEQSLEITLKFKLVDAELHKILCFPFLSRDAVKEDKSRKDTYMKMLESIRYEGPGVFIKNFWGFADLMIAERGMMQTTVMADVIVECIESFQVKDIANNEVLQGDGVERTVRHLVRMELDSTVVEEDDQEVWTKSNWRIADFDDQLVGRGLQWAPI